MTASSCLPLGIISAQITLDVGIECIISLLGNIPQAECRARMTAGIVQKISKRRHLKRKNGLFAPTNIYKKT